MKIKKKNLLLSLKILLIIMLYIFGIINQNNLYLTILLISNIVFGSYLVFNSLFEIKIFILFILLYPLTFLQYLIYDKKLSVYTEFYTFENLYHVGITMFLFLMILFVSIGVIKKDNNLNMFDKHPKSKIIFWICILLIFYMGLTGISGTIGDYRKVHLSAKVEYMIVPYIVLSLFSSKKQRKYIGFMYFIYSLIILLLGSRVPALFLIYTVILINKDIFKKLRNNKGLILIFLGIFLMKFIEKTRNLDGTYLERINTILKRKSVNLIVNNESDVIYAGSALIGLIRVKILTLETSIKTWLYMFTDFFRIKIFKENLLIPLQILKNTPIGGGGILNEQLFYLGKEFLIIVGALFIGVCIRNFFNNFERKTYKNIYSLIAIITVFRWYPYTPITLYKMSGYCIVFYFILFYLSKINNFLGISFRKSKLNKLKKEHRNIGE